jgi:hypothetical protein
VKHFKHNVPKISASSYMLSRLEAYGTFTLGLKGGSSKMNLVQKCI